MFNRNRSLQQLAAIVSISLVAGCSLLGEEGSDDAGPIVVGTTSAPSTLDPAASWDGSWELFRNIYQTLLSYPTGATEPQPDAAKSCEFTDTSNRSYRCELREGLTFSNGDKLDANAVKHSIDRIKEINAPTGPAGLLGSLDRVQVRGDREVVFQLNKADATFPFVLATPGMSIVSPDDYPAKSLRKDGGIVGSGPYQLEGYDEGKQAELVRNDRYKGFAERRNDAVTIRYFQDSGTMVKALRGGQIDLTYQGLAGDDIVALEDEDNQGLQLIEGDSSNINYLVFNPKDPMANKLAVRRAVAQVIDRPAIAHKVYKDTVDPLYSMVPKGLTGHTTAFFDDFGEPDADKARAILADADITEPVPLTLWYTTDRYGSDTALEFKEIKSQLEASGLFKVTLKSRPWKTYVLGYQNGEYPVFGRGWAPDFPDADNFIAPFVGEQNALGTPYPQKEITQVLLPRSREESDRANVVKEFQEAQQILVEEARLLPLWQGKQYIAANEDVSGAERALDPSTIMMMWELSRKTSW
ncbi:ABC transporter substrate-binding protein [Streptomyces aurantiogriseus]|uniref:Solute-binding transport lipoprotein n=1 Tax=Streptomyces aurantiogriseus TaxID=66870 RepID=A0A918FBI4_9ACTN|nr:ABC transporter substrate-binding protein [Streptomyces aurantiogriseus]GGR27738.1 solute-binding transport lipoprotein [Streptomyces aurantiogriseus]